MVWGLLLTIGVFSKTTRLSGRASSWHTVGAEDTQRTEPCPPRVPGLGLRQDTGRLLWAGCLVSMHFLSGHSCPSGQQLQQAVLMGGTGGEAPPGHPCHRDSWTHRPHLCCCFQPRVGTVAARDILSLGEGYSCWERCRVTWEGRQTEGTLASAFESHHTQTDAYTDRHAVTNGHHTLTQIPLPNCKLHTWLPTPGVWAKPALGEAELVSNNKGRKDSNQRQNRKNCAPTSGTSLRSCCFYSSSDWGL